MCCAYAPVASGYKIEYMVNEAAPLLHTSAKSLWVLVAGRDSEGCRHEVWTQPVGSHFIAPGSEVSQAVQSTLVGPSVTHTCYRTVSRAVYLLPFLQRDDKHPGTTWVILQPLQAMPSTYRHYNIRTCTNLSHLDIVYDPHARTSLLRGGCRFVADVHRTVWYMLLRWERVVGIATAWRSR